MAPWRTRTPRHRHAHPADHKNHMPRIHEAKKITRSGTTRPQKSMGKARETRKRNQSSPRTRRRRGRNQYPTVDELEITMNASNRLPLFLCSTSLSLSALSKCEGMRKGNDQTGRHPAPKFKKDKKPTVPGRDGAGPGKRAEEENRAR